MEETIVPGENHRLTQSHWQLSHKPLMVKNFRKIVLQAIEIFTSNVNIRILLRDMCIISVYACGCNLKFLWSWFKYRAPKGVMMSHFRHPLSKSSLGMIPNIDIECRKVSYHLRSDLPILLYSI